MTLYIWNSGLNKMKKLLLLFLIFFICFAPAFSATDVYSYVISAYKVQQSYGTPEVSFRMINAEGSQFYSSNETAVDEELIPVENISENKVFSWILSGNKLGLIKMNFTFSPLKTKVDDVVVGTINYDMKIVHETTKIGNMVVPVNGTTTIVSDYYGYDFEYVDSVIINQNTTNQATITVDSDNQRAKFKYDFSSSAPSSFPGTTCDYWNRKGSGYVTMDIPDNPEPGYYYADVSVRFTVD